MAQTEEQQIEKTGLYRLEWVVDQIQKSLGFIDPNGNLVLGSGKNLTVGGALIVMGNTTLPGILAVGGAISGTDKLQVSGNIKLTANGSSIFGSTTNTSILFSDLLQLSASTAITSYVNGTVRSALFNTGNLVLQSGGVFNDDGVNRLQVTGSIKSSTFFNTAASDSSGNGQYRIGGTSALSTYGTGNLFVGNAGNYTLTGTFNVLVGAYAGANLTTAINNTFLGVSSGMYITGSDNVAIGTSALFGYTHAGSAKNVVIGNNAGYSFGVSSLNNSVLIGYNAGANIAGATHSNVVLIGHDAGAGEANLSDTVLFGKSATPMAVKTYGTIIGSQYRLTALNTAPASATATGTAGEIRFTSSGIYLCTAANTWVKATVATF